MREENKKARKCGCHPEEFFSLVLLTKINTTVINKYMLKIT